MLIKSFNVLVAAAAAAAAAAFSSPSSVDIIVDIDGLNAQQRTERVLLYCCIVVCVLFVAVEMTLQ
jgi:hypothetical protein